MVLGLTTILLKHGSINIMQEVIESASTFIIAQLLSVFNQMSNINVMKSWSGIAGVAVLFLDKV